MGFKGGFGSNRIGSSRLSGGPSAQGGFGSSRLSGFNPSAMKSNMSGMSGDGRTSSKGSGFKSGRSIPSMEITDEVLKEVMAKKIE